MARYNLYLMDATRDPRVIRRIAALTQVDPAVLGPHLLRFPFLVLREVPLSQAVAVRRELERLGLSLSIENLPPDRITGNSRHPLAGEQPAAETRTRGTGREEVVLEAGSGFQVLEPEPVAPSVETPRTRTPGALARRVVWLLGLAGRRRVIQFLGVALLALCLIWLGFHLGSPRGVPLTPAARAQAEGDLQRLLLQARTAVEQGLPEGAAGDRLLEEVQALSALLAQAGNSLPGEMARQLEELEAFAATLELRRSGGLSPAPGALEGFAEPDLDQPGTEAELRTLLEADTPPVSRPELARLEFLERAASGQFRTGQLAAEARQRLDRLASRTRERLDRTRARILAGSLRQRGVALVPEDGNLRLLAALPDSTRLEIGGATGVDVVQIVDGQVLIRGIADKVNSVSVRLAALDRQPSSVRSILETGLRLMDPATYFDTLPGSTLPSGRPLKRAQDLDLALAAIEMPEGARVESRGNFLDASFPPRIEHSRAREVLGRCARAYLETRQWPRRVEMELDGRHYSLTGMDLWMLSREGLDQK